MAEIKKDCFAYRENMRHQCNALNQLYCAVEECPFYKNKEEYNKNVRHKPN